jgi:hypothetical protein
MFHVNRRILMRRVMIMAGIIALIAVLSPTSALAKGPSSASIEGPGIVGSIDVGGEPGSGEPESGGTLAQLAEHAGMFAVGLGVGTTQLSDQRPDGELGPELTVEFTVPGPDTRATSWCNASIRGLTPGLSPTPSLRNPSWAWRRSVDGTPAANR